MGAVNEAPAAFRSSTDRPGPVALIRNAITDVWSRRRLIGYMVRADIKKRGVNTVLGNVWWVLDPLITMLIYVLVMTVIFQRSTPDFPLFLLSAMVPFKWFTATIGSSTNAVIGKEGLIKQIVFPKIILPVTSDLSQVVSFLFGMLVLFGVLLVAYTSHLTIQVVWVPLIAVVQFVFVLGFTFMVSAITVFYRDVGIVIGHFMRLLFWISPILWSFNAVAAPAARAAGLLLTAWTHLETAVELVGPARPITLPSPGTTRASSRPCVTCCSCARRCSSRGSASASASRRGQPSRRNSICAASSTRAMRCTPWCRWRRRWPAPTCLY